MTKRIVTLGEIMMRLSVPGFGRFTQAENFQAVYGGSEANVGVSLSNFGLATAHVTRLPDNDLGKAVVAHLRRHNVYADYCVFGSERLGLYFLENGSMHRAPRIIYDRFDSAFAHIKPGMINWDEIMQQASWFHWTGITPAISQGAADVCKEAIVAANKHGVTVSGDINYRRNLWQYGKSANEIMPALIEGTQIMIAGRSDIENCTGIVANDYAESCKQVMKRYPNIKKVTYTHRDTISASHNKIQGVLFDGTTLLRSKEFDLTHIVDRVGAGDAFMAGLIYGLIHKHPDKQLLEFATAACALKHGIEGDVNQVTVEEVEGLVQGENTGKLLR